MNAVDTNVFVYALDADEPVKQTKAEELLQRLVMATGSTVLPWQVAGELLSNLRKRESDGRISSSDVESRFRKFLGMFPLALPTVHVFSTYFDLRARFSLSHWDAMLLAACKEAGVTTLFSEDMNPGTDYDGLKIVNLLPEAGACVRAGPIARRAGRAGRSVERTLLTTGILDAIMTSRNYESSRIETRHLDTRYEPTDHPFATDPVPPAIKR